MLERPVIVALDFPDASSALEFAARLDPSLCRVKVGFELFVSAGPALVEQLVSRGFEVFLDLKFHDIPNTVAAACRAAAGLGVWMLNLHAGGGPAMMQAAREALDKEGGRRPLLIAVTVLTSMDDRDLSSVGVTVGAREQVLRLARLTHDSGLDGVVCSAVEAPDLRAALPEDFVLVTPGIRPADADAGDQKRVVTPSEALRIGADYLVIGRPITQAADPLGRLQDIVSNLEA
ncbi:MAG: orotidine-5'-phosphate decarboxylase [Acidihalobacter sp.]|jgi:orotidine-5'-phosphate decarboxylase